MARTAIVGDGDLGRDDLGSHPQHAGNWLQRALDGGDFFGAVHPIDIKDLVDLRSE